MGVRERERERVEKRGILRKWGASKTSHGTYHPGYLPSRNEKTNAEPTEKTRLTLNNKENQLILSAAQHGFTSRERERERERDRY